MRVERLCNSTDIRSLLRRIGVDTGGEAILAQKASLHFIRIDDLHVGAANILKQDALSVGADLAVPKGTVIASAPRVDAVLIANERQLRELARKEKAQPFGLKELAVELESFLGLLRPSHVCVMGIVNANEDSFYRNSRFEGESAVAKIVSMVEEGAEIIDIGGVSSRPGSAAVSADEELRRVKPIIDAVYERHLSDRARFSLDSYEPEVIRYALDRGFTIVNDITGLANDDVAKLCGEYNATAVIMHMLGTPQTMQHHPEYESVITEIDLFFKERIEKAHAFGVKEIVLDAGIGFGKRLEDNLALITHQKHLLRHGYPILVGASRKSLINAISPSLSEERLPGTLAIHLKAIEEGASIIRVHDVKEHIQALRVWEALRG